MRVQTQKTDACTHKQPVPACLTLSNRIPLGDLFCRSLYPHRTSSEFIQLPVLRSQIANVWFNGERLAGGALDQLVGGELGAVLVDVFLEPTVKCREFAAGDLVGDAGVRTERGGVELG